VLVGALGAPESEARVLVGAWAVELESEARVSVGAWAVELESEQQAQGSLSPRKRSRRSRSGRSFCRPTSLNSRGNSVHYVS
jgi:hypothetical protein